MKTVDAHGQCTCDRICLFATHVLRDAHCTWFPACHSNRTAPEVKYMCRHIVVFMHATPHRHSSWNAHTFTTTHAQTCTHHATHHPRAAALDPLHTVQNPTRALCDTKQTDTQAHNTTAGALSLSHTHTLHNAGGMKANRQQQTHTPGTRTTPYTRAVNCRYHASYVSTSHDTGASIDMQPA